MSLGTILLIILILLLVSALPAWPYSRGWGYGPSGVAGLLVVILLLLVLFMVLRIPAVQRKFFGAIEGMYGLLGYSDGLFRDVAMAFRRILFG